MLQAVSCSGLGTGDDGCCWGGFEAISQSQQVQAMEQEVFTCTLGFLQNTQLNTDLHP